MHSNATGPEWPCKLTSCEHEVFFESRESYIYIYAYRYIHTYIYICMCDIYLTKKTNYKHIIYIYRLTWDKRPPGRPRHCLPQAPVVYSLRQSWKAGESCQAKFCYVILHYVRLCCVASYCCVCFYLICMILYCVISCCAMFHYFTICNSCYSSMI